jgi:hypothetical protein
MAIHPQSAEPDDPPAWRLTAGLDAKLAELRGQGF